jgi:5-methylcytosine-specific restriction enzyme A
VLVKSRQPLPDEQEGESLTLKTLRPRLKCLRATALTPPSKKAAPLYDEPAWRALVRSLIATRGSRCEACGITGKRIYGDHVVEIADGGAPMDPSNVQLVCPSCHGKKTAAARAARAARVW